MSFFFSMPRGRALAAFGTFVALGILAACAAAPVCPAPTPPAPCDRDLQPLAAAPKPTIDDPLHPKDAEAPSAIAVVEAGSLNDAGATVSQPATGKDGGTAVAVKVTPKPAAANGDPSSCGTKDNLCPLQKVMRGMASAGTGPALAVAFAHVANLSPNGAWQWRAMSQKGAELAKSDDIAGAKAQCKACHDAYKAQYKATYRARPIR